MPRADAKALARRKRREEITTHFFPAPLARNRYRVHSLIGEGAYGVVCSAIDTTTNHRVAVKRILKCLGTHPMATRVLRELKFLRMLSAHQNIIQVKDVLLPSDIDRFNDTFVVFELMPTDLNRLLKTDTTLTHAHIKYFMFQLLCGINFMHDARVFHRDLKPNNVLINGRCQLRICDFGLARAAFEDGPDTLFWTDYVATRWYRAPELIMAYYTKYSTAIDLWSVGCIFAEMLGGGKVLFEGKNSRHQIELITDVIGPPPASAIQKLRDPQARRVLSEFQNMTQPQRPLDTLFPDADPLAIDVLRGMLAFDPDERISAVEALRYPYFSEYLHLGLGAKAEPLPASEFNFERSKLSPDQMREEFLREILHYHPEASVEVLRRWSTGHAYQVRSAVDQFGREVSRLVQNNPGMPIASQTLQERVMEEITQENRMVETYAERRQHVTMTESEMSQFMQR
ncbi:Mitogen-activated protein kinase 9, MPK9 [Chondrus crispus]|uniref:Mitogen-activated protein kinase 9, MPK9 n=1 Tax=Chondrus crispus TaxID=2769 RepID=R7Q568_CHOCR|nr:Mitogen-activated protein kinase 9, MPK9 [Chondrus crispus]CDF33702.1 Mitogen-activated protein kinase 9, MPK9 [Chondrus crispus]|eukprot:XP_005713521.1 Mitogen-activated protein kinase 9, MPK9 [Chondrus crispus]